MKRSFLEELGLDKDQINKIMDENGRDINAKTEEITALKDELNKTKDNVNSLEEKANKAEKLQDKLSDLTAANDELKKTINQEKVKSALIEAGATDIDYLTYKLGDIQFEDSEFGKKLDDLKKDHAAFFKQESAEKESESRNNHYPGYQILDNRLIEGESKPGLTKKDILNIADRDERQKAILDNLELFNQ